MTQLPGDAELHRQVSPKLLKMDGTVMSSAFVPKKTDNDKLSTRQGAIMSPKTAYNLHISLGLNSVGTWSFYVRDADPAVVLDDAQNADAHASVCFHHCNSRGEREKLGKQIRARAVMTHRPAA